MVISPTSSPNGVGARRISPEEVRGYIAAALDRAQADAASKDRARFTLEEYRLQAIKIGQENNLSPADWNPAVYANLSAGNLGDRALVGLAISEPRLAKRDPHANADFMDLDADGTINPFYTNINFDGTKLSDCIVDPAASFNMALARAGEITDTTFNDQEGDARFVLGSGQYHNIALTNFKGGTVVLEGSRVEGLNIAGQQITQLSMQAHGGQKPFISGLNGDGARFVRIDGVPGAEISGSLRNTTISQAGNMVGMTLTNVDFSGANLNGVNLSNAHLTNVTLTADPRANRGMDLTGATLVDVKLDNGELITSLQQLQALGINFDSKKPPTITYKEAGLIESAPPAVGQSHFASILSADVFKGSPLAVADATVIDLGNVGVPDSHIVADNFIKAPQPDFNPNFFAEMSAKFTPNAGGSGSSNA